ncbi:MAG: right-handed parallel beta-helix repeat-containing protein, partial [Armatimonadota bacterium]
LTTWGATGGLGYGNLQNVYIGHNVYRMEHGGDREAITADAPGGYFQGKPESADAASLTVPSKPGRVGSGIYVLDGKGRGQYRRLAAVEGNKLTVDRPWDVIPDASSSISVTHLLQHWLIVGNDLEDVGAVQSFGVFMECVMADNVSARQSGYRSWGLNYSDASQPTWYCQILGNRIREGNYYHGTYGVCAVEASLGTTGGQPAKETGGCLLRGIVLRGNRCDNNSGMDVGGASTDVVIENNSIARADNGLSISGGSTGVFVRGNRWESVRNPLGGEGLAAAWVEPAQRVAAIRARLQQLYEDAGLTEDPASDKAVAAAIAQLAQASPETAAAAENAVMTAVAARLVTAKRDLPLGRVAGALGLVLNAPAAGSPVFLTTPDGKGTVEFVLTLSRNYPTAWTAAAQGLQLPTGWSRVGQPEAVPLQPGKPTRITATVAVPADTRGRVTIPFALAVGPAGAPLRLRSVVSLYVTGDAPLTHLDFERQTAGAYPNQLGGGFEAKIEGNVPQDSEGVGRSVAFEGKSYLTLPDFGGMFPASVTVALWIKPGTLSGRHGLVVKRLDNAGTPFVLT